jgi:hypothetical protein
MRSTKPSESRNFQEFGPVEMKDPVVIAGVNGERGLLLSDKLATGTGALIANFDRGRAFHGARLQMGGSARGCRRASIDQEIGRHLPHDLDDDR